MLCFLFGSLRAAAITFFFVVFWFTLTLVHMTELAKNKSRKKGKGISTNAERLCDVLVFPREKQHVFYLSIHSKSLLGILNQ